MELNTNIKKEPLKWDRLNSTFHWLIFLDEHHESYAYKAQRLGSVILDGYSGSVGHNERNNKQELLLKNFIFLTKNYSFKSKAIRIFVKCGEIIDKNNDICIIEIYPDKPPLITKAAKEIIYNKTKLFDESFCKFLLSLWQMNHSKFDINQFRPQ